MRHIGNMQTRFNASNTILWFIVSAAHPLENLTFYLYYSCFLPTSNMKMFVFSFEVLASAPSGREVCVVVFTFLTGTWMAAGDLTRRRQTSVRWGFRDRISDPDLTLLEVSVALKMLNYRFSFLVVQFYLKGSKVWKRCVELPSVIVSGMEGPSDWR